MIQSSPFLPALPAVQSGDIGRVQFPGTSQAGRGNLSLADRIPTVPGHEHTKTTTGPSTYTRQPSQIRVGGLYEPRTVGRPSAAFHGHRLGGVHDEAGQPYSPSDYDHDEG